MATQIPVNGRDACIMSIGQGFCIQGQFTGVVALVQTAQLHRVWSRNLPLYNITLKMCDVSLKLLGSRSNTSVDFSSSFD